MLHRTFQLQHHEPAPDATVVSVAGDLDIASAPALKQALGDLMGTGIRHVEIDLAAADFIDSSGLGALLWAERRLSAVGGDLAITHAEGNIGRTFELAGMDGLLTH